MDSSNSDEDLRIRGRQSGHLNTIKEALANGRRITHILNIKVSKEPNSVIGDQIRRMLYSKINRVENVATVSNVPGIQVTWEMPNASSTSAYYFTDSIYSDRITLKHTRVVLSRIVREIKDRFADMNREGYRDDWGVTYLVTSPVGNRVVDELAADDLY